MPGALSQHFLTKTIMHALRLDWRHTSGVSLAEVMTAISVSTTVAAVAMPMFLTGLDGFRAAGAARYFAARLAMVRMEAVKRARTVAVRFEPDGNGFRFCVYVDGNRNGVRTADIADGTDWPLGDADRLNVHFRNVAFGIGASVPGVDGEAAGADSDPIRFGRSNLLSYTPVGTSSSGTAYIRSLDGTQYAVRVLGATGRTRLLEYRPEERRWKER
jgi:hypothetical protein